ncbi:IclR family transcriptional regulator domain-containing protein [Pseudoclavibacter sp. 8L]|uniref:IclR family transcriptional regulator domain-containing protein n=1 Tax=Pseudoclavibacter sp. 8L TaxID=2653162 RepID=UPI0012F331C0|nr:IclR family transcriptional regulator C-terminal domain-containing protein [Pseudoclavibacter sp. 8L]VXC06687.1 IclR family transcriptional regulator [Pseudoclavibacter sp. 8L]
MTFAIAGPALPLTLDMEATMGGTDEIGAVVKALNVLQVFSSELPRASISEVAEASGYTRPTARRILMTYEQHGFLATDGKYFWPTPKVLRLGFTYLSSLPYWDIAQPHLRLLADELEESCSLATLDGTEVVYVARVAVRRSVIQLNVGSRLPAHATSLGKAILAFSTQATLDDYLAHATFEQLTPNTVPDRTRFSEQLEQARVEGFAINDGEREIGVSSVAAPLLSPAGVALGAINVSVNSLRVPFDTLKTQYAPRLLETARAISEEMSYSGR